MGTKGWEALDPDGDRQTDRGTVSSGTPDWQLVTTTDAEKNMVEAVGTKYSAAVNREEADFVNKWVSEMVVQMIGKT